MSIISIVADIITGAFAVAAVGYVVVAILATGVHVGEQLRR